MASEAQVSKALAWETGQKPPPNKSVWEWLWEAIQGDFNDNRSTGQVAFDAGISMIPVIDQICDVRDIIANCKSIAQSNEKEDNTWKYIAVALTLIGLFPSLGSLVKGVLKIFFAFIRRYGLNHAMKAVDDGLTWVVTFLRKPEVQKELRRLKVDEVFGWLAKEIKAIRGKVNTAELLAAFDRGIKVMKGLLDKVTWLPGGIGKRAQDAINMVEKVRKTFDQHIGTAIKPVQDLLDKITRRLDTESLVQRSGILNAHNIHFRGTLPEVQAVALMRKPPPPKWLSKTGDKFFKEQKIADGQKAIAAAKKVHPDWDCLNEKNIRSFHSMRAIEIKGPAKLYRVVSPSNGAMGDCWIPEDVWKKVMDSPDPKAAWRQYLAVWPNWNPNGQFVVMDIPLGETLKVWRGPASSQKMDSLKDLHLEGGWDQIIFKPSKDNKVLGDTTRYYKLGGGNGTRLEKPINQAEVDALMKKMNSAEKTEFWRTHTGIREKINDPRIKGPLDTGWGYTDFDPQLTGQKIGLPAFPGQTTN